MCISRSIKIEINSLIVTRRLGAGEIVKKGMDIMQKIILNPWELSIEALDYRETVHTPYTWNVGEQTQNYCGKARYTTKIELAQEQSGKRLFLHFEAVYHSAAVYVNGRLAGKHCGSGYTPFEFEITDLVFLGRENEICVEADNSPSRHALPWCDRFDWADDGGIIRQATMLICAPEEIKRLFVTPQIDRIDGETASGTLELGVCFADGRRDGEAQGVLTEFESGEEVCRFSCKIRDNRVQVAFDSLKLWDFDHPTLYRLELRAGEHAFTQRFGVRKIEISGREILLNGKSVYLTGCEWMPGSHPDYGMAEPFEHSVKCLRQLKESGCRFTRFHWQQDDKIMDWCDENGLLVQEEIPYWGAPGKVGPEQTEIAKRQANEMVAAHYNHPSIIFWGAGNELNGYARRTIGYVREMVRYFKSKDPTRPVNYVSNTMGNPGINWRDDATLYGDVAMWNEYLGLWQPCEDIENRLRLTASKCKNKPLVISEFGLCEPHFSGGDERRSSILSERLALYRSIEAIRGYIWFSLNDYRTHLGESGEGRFQCRIHGSTDLYGTEKPSYRLFCAENEKTNAMKK